MNRTVVMIMGGAVLVAIVVAMIVQAKLGNSGSKNAEVPSVEILVATKKLMTGERLSAENTHWQNWPQTATYQGVILKSSEADPAKASVYDTPLRRDIEAGEPVTTQALISDIKGGGNFLAASLHEGMRAVSIPVSAETSVSGFISPGDHVDIILTYQPRIDSDNREISQQIVLRDATQTILSNVNVLAVDQTSKDDGGEAKVGKTVTLEVTKQQSEILALARSMGDLSLALRRLGEKDSAKDAPLPLTTDATTSEVMIKLNDIKRKSQTNSGTVRVYSGTTIQNVPVRQGESQP